MIVEKPRHPSEIRRGRDKFGIAPGYLPDRAYRDAHLDVVKDLGARWVRVDFNWSQIEPAVQGTFDWALTDALVASCVARGLKILGTLFLRVPAWARSNAGSSITMPTNPLDLGKFAVACQARYPFIHHWEIGNEINLAANMSVPNLVAYGSPASASPTGRAYAKLLRGAVPQMKVQDPSCTIVSAGLAPTDTAGGSMNEVEFLHGFYWEQGANYCDAIGAHPYSQPLRGGELYNLDTINGLQTWSAWGRMHGYSVGAGVPAGAAAPIGTTVVERNAKGQATGDLSTLSTIRQVMTVHGDAGKKVWITEFGAHTGLVANGGVTQAEQVEQVKRAYAMAQSLDWVGPVFWFSAKDLAADGAMANSWGLMDFNGNQKAAYATYKALAQAAAA